MAGDIFAEDFKTDPYWWDAAPRPKMPAAVLPDKADVVVIGSGYTGLNAALTAQRGGRQVLVLEAEDTGYGASTRNAGYVGRALWQKFGTIQRKFGAERAISMANTVIEAHNYLVELIEKEQISCGFNYRGRIIAACTPGHYDYLAKELSYWEKHGLDMPAEMIPAADQSREIGSSRFHGGLLLHDTGALHPGLYHQGLLERVIAGGTSVLDHTPVIRAARDRDDGFTVTTSRGAVRAKDVVVATNGYNATTVPWHRRRIIPIKGYIVATEPLAPDVMNALFPTGRTMLDSKINIFAFRPSPDGTRLLLFGRTGMDDGGLSGKARELHAGMTWLFPDLRDVKLTHCWDGQMGFTFDLVPHIGSHDGLHYAMGYNGAGLPMGTYLGSRLGKWLLGDQAVTGFDAHGFPTRPLYFGNPWVLPLIIGYYNTRDWWDLRSA